MLTELPEWRALERHRGNMDGVHMRELFTADPSRFMRFSRKADGIFADFSKHLVTGETLSLLIDLAKARQVEEWRDRMMRGEAINTSENRPVLHTALRAPAEYRIEDKTEDKTEDHSSLMITDTLARMRAFCEKLESGHITGVTGRRITTFVNIGIGGSDLGPRMICEALSPFATSTADVRFVANVDSREISATLKDLDPEATFFLVASKTFTTQETMANAAFARTWLARHIQNPDAHFIALTANEDAARAFGIAAEHVFPFPEGVGGRYSLWSSIGFAIAIKTGFANFRALLDGAHAMDRHFSSAPLDVNIPVILALLGIWYRNFWDRECHAVIPYCSTLERFPAWLQQLDMESNGKSVDRDGQRIGYDTGPIIIGATGTNAQHAFFQFLHQGTNIVPCDFIGFAEPSEDAAPHHDMLMANMAAQAQALMQGRPPEESGGDLRRSFDGNRPSATLLLDQLDPFHLGLLLALYEHRTFVQGIIWNINSFDQWGGRAWQARYPRYSQRPKTLIYEKN